MGVGDLKISAQEAARSAQAWQKSMNASRSVPQVNRRVQRIINEEVVHIFSVSPWKHRCDMGNWGSFTIPECPPDKEYVEFHMQHENGEPGPIPGILRMPYPVSESQMAVHEEDGMDWALRLLNEDMGISPSRSLRRYGVFPSTNEKPSKKELEQARAELNNRFKELVQEARDWYPDRVRREGISNDTHGMAARALGLENEPWLIAGNPQGRKKCPLCGGMNDMEVIKCGNCREYVFDQDKYAAILKAQGK